MLADPAVSLGLFATVGAGVGGQTGNNGRMYITLKPWTARRRRLQVIARLDRRCKPVQGIKLFLQPVAGCERRRRGCADAVSVHAPGRRTGRTQHLGAEDPGQAADTAACWRDVTSDQEDRRHHRDTTYRPRQAARFGMQPAAIDDILYDAFGQREIAQYFTAGEGLLRDPGGAAGQAGDAGDAGQAVREVVDRSGGAALHAGALDTVPVQPLAINHQSQFPAVTISFNLAGRASLGDAVTPVNEAMRQMGVPITVAGIIPGHRAGVPVVAGQPSPI